MKKMRYFFLLSLLFTGFQGFAQSKWEVPEIMQSIVDLEPMTEVWEKGGLEPDQTAQLISHDHFPETPSFNINGQTVKVLNSVDEASTADTPFIDVTEFRIKKGKKARLEFTFNDIRVKAIVVKQDGVWGHRSLSISGRGIHHKSLDWTF